MSTPRIHSSPLGAAFSMLFSSITSSSSAVSSAIRRCQALLPLRVALFDAFLNLNRRSPPIPPPPLPPPPTRVLEQFGPYMVSRTLAYAAPSASRRFNSAVRESGGIFPSVRSPLAFGFVISIIGVFGFGYGCSLVFCRASRGVSSKPRATSNGKPGIFSSPRSARFLSALGTLMRIVVTSCCLCGVIHYSSYLMPSVRLASNPNVGIMLVDVESPILLDNLHRFLVTLENSASEVVCKWIRDRDFTNTVAALKDIIDALTFAASGATSNLVLRETVHCNGAAFDVVTQTCLFPNAVILDTIHRSREMIHTTVTAVLANPTYNMTRIVIRTEAMASYIYEVLRFDSLPLPLTMLATTVPLLIRGADKLLDVVKQVVIPVTTCIQYFPIPTVGDLFDALMLLGLVIKFMFDAVQAMRDFSSGAFCQNFRSLVTLVAAPWMNVDVLAWLKLASARITTAFRIYVRPAPRVVSLPKSIELDAILADDSILPPYVDVLSSVGPSPDQEVVTTLLPPSSMSTEGSNSEPSEDVPQAGFRYIVQDSEKASPRKSKNVPQLRINTASLVKSVQDASTDSSSLTSSRHSLSDSMSYLSGELTPATSVPDVSLAIPQPQEVKSFVSVPFSPQDEVIDRQAVASSASSSAMAPLVAPVEKEGEWTVVTYKKPKRRTHDWRQDDTAIVPRYSRPRPHTVLPARPQAHPPKPASSSPSCGPSKVSSALPKSSKLSLGSLRGTRTTPDRAVWSLPKPASASSSASKGPWSTVSGEPATASTKAWLNEEWFPRLPSRETPPLPLQSGVQERDPQDHSRVSSPSGDAVEEGVQTYSQGVEDVPPSFSYDEYGNFLQTIEPMDLFGQPGAFRPVVRLPPSPAYGGKTFAALPNEVGLHNPLVVPPETRSQIMLEDLFERVGPIVVNIPRSTFRPRI